MISILIPVYNYKVNNLIKELYTQCLKANLVFEILIFDDKSRPSIKKHNEHLGHMVGVNYMELSENVGRSKIRNWLGTSARYENLLFLDCDSRIKSKRFVKKYLEAIENNEVVYGGTIYSEKPKNIKKVLHWTFGSNREVRPAKARNKSPYLSFTSNNFMIKKSVFESLLFDQEIKGYGYEDLVFSRTLELNGQSIFHIDNPVFHLGLETTDVYLKKILRSIENLVQLEFENKISDTRLIQFYKKLEKYKLLPVVLKMVNWRKENIEKNLYSSFPKLRNLDLFKLINYHKCRSSFMQDMNE